MKWLPIIDAAKRKALLAKLDEIADTLLKNIHHFKSNHGIGSDRIGVVLFLFYYARLTQEEKYADAAFELVSRVFDEINADLEKGAVENSLIGFPFLGWVLLLLEHERFVDSDMEEILKEMDEPLYQRMIFEMKKGKYDYIKGALSKGLYFLSRVKNPAIRSYLGKLVDVIEEVCEKDANEGLKIARNFQDIKGNECSDYNLGLAHGIPSITWFLGKIIEQDIAKDKATYLLEGFTSYILGHSQDMTKYLSNFPRYGGPGSPPGNSRLAWCYGDLGIGISLWQAAQIGGRKDWEKKALQVLMHSTGRRDLNENDVVDAGLCHGTAGIAHIYNRMYHYTGAGEFKQASLYWFDETLKMARYSGGYAGFEYQIGDDSGEWRNATNILVGISGIGLAMISAVSTIEPNWDRVLLLS